MTKVVKTSGLIAAGLAAAAHLGSGVALAQDGGAENRTGGKVDAPAVETQELATPSEADTKSEKEARQSPTELWRAWLNKHGLKEGRNEIDGRMVFVARGTAQVRKSEGTAVGSIRARWPTIRRNWPPSGRWRNAWARR